MIALGCFCRFVWLVMWFFMKTVSLKRMCNTFSFFLTFYPFIFFSTKAFKIFQTNSIIYSKNAFSVPNSCVTHFIGSPWSNSQKSQSKRILGIDNYFVVVSRCRYRLYQTVTTDQGPQARFCLLRLIASNRCAGSSSDPVNPQSGERA